jgi:DNA-binding NarL/FixJ family response regulator
VGRSADGSRALGAAMLRGGALGYVTKISAGAEFPVAIRLAYRNQTVVSPGLDS